MAPNKKKEKDPKRVQRSSTKIYRRNLNFYPSSQRFEFVNYPMIPAYNHNFHTPYRHYQRGRDSRYHSGTQRIHTTIRREPSPLNGSEEYTQRKIQETSDMIKRQLMGPDNTPVDHSYTKSDTLPENKSPKPKRVKKPITQPRKTQFRQNNKAVSKGNLKKGAPVQKSSKTYNVKEIHNQIMEHILKLNSRRKQNLINADSTGYDTAIQQIYKQQSLELSKALREMSHQETPEASKVVNSIIPDFAIKFEELPVDVIRELSSVFETLNQFGTESSDMLNVTCPQVNNHTDENYQDITVNSEDSQERIMLVNAEDNDSIVIKPEDLLANKVKDECSEVIEILDTEDDSILFCQVEKHGNGVSDQPTTSEVQDFSSSSVNQSNSTLLPSCLVSSESNENASVTNTEVNTMVLASSPPQPTIGSLRVRRSIFEKSSCPSLYDSQQQHESSNTNSEENINQEITSSSQLSISNTSRAVPIAEVPQPYTEQETFTTQTDTYISQQSSTSNSSNTIANRNISSTRIPGNTYISVKVEQLKKPVDLSEAVEMMLEIDSEIEKLTKLRQAFLLDMNEINSRPRTEKRPNKKTLRKLRAKRRKTNNQIVNDNQNFVPGTADSRVSVVTVEQQIRQEDDVIDLLEKELESIEASRKETTNTANTSVGTISVPDNPNSLTGIIVVMKVLPEENLLITGTDNGKILYFSLPKKILIMTVGVSKSAITGLEIVCIGKNRWVFTTTDTECHMKCLEFKKHTMEKKISLQDSVKLIHQQWNYFFIGGRMGYLTRYNFLKGKIEYEDCISEMNIVDLKATREGPRKILLILFKRTDGNKEIHVRDAWSALHIRTIIDGKQSLNCIVPHNSFVYFVSDKEITVFDFCNGQYVMKFWVNSPNNITLMRAIGNLLLAVSSDGIYAYNMKTAYFMGHLKCDSMASITYYQDKIYYGTQTKRLKSLSIPENMMALNPKLFGKGSLH